VTDTCVGPGPEAEDEVKLWTRVTTVGIDGPTHHPPLQLINRIFDAFLEWWECI